MIVEKLIIRKNNESYRLIYDFLQYAGKVIPRI